MSQLIDLVKKFEFKNVFLKINFEIEPGHHVFVTGLLPHEQCLSVLNIVLNCTNDSEIILKSKERLVFHVGFVDLQVHRFILNIQMKINIKFVFIYSITTKFLVNLYSLNDFSDHAKH